MSEPFLSASAAAKAAGIGRDKLRALTLAGVVPAYQPAGVGRKLYLASEVTEAIRARRFCVATDAAAQAEAAVLRLRQAQAGSGR